MPELKQFPLAPRVGPAQNLSLRVLAVMMCVSGDPMRGLR
jgi:hypothetical protein